MRTLLLFLCLTVLPTGASAQTWKALFDDTKNETAGNADWIIDTDQPVPSPAQSGITTGTAESYWLGAISAWGVDMVKHGFTVHTLTSAYGITYGNGSNPYDLSNYNVFIVCEPQGPFSAAEKTAIKSFVQNGGGLMMVADHDGSDRNSDGWDSPKVWNDFRTDSTFGIHFQSTGETNNNISQVDSNIAAGSDPLINGLAGTVLNVSYHNGTTITLLPSVNPDATGHIWMNGAAHGNSQVTFATSRYGAGKVAGVGDSSPADDGSAQPGNSSIFPGWTEVGSTDSYVFLNACLWMVTPDTVAQATLVSPADLASNLTLPISFTWRTVSGAAKYQYLLSTSNTFSTTIANDSSLTDTTRNVSGLSDSTTYYWKVRAKSATTWGSYSTARSFTTAAATFTISATAGSNGSIAPPGDVVVNSGATQTFTISSDTGYHVDSLFVDAVSLSLDTSYTFMNVTANHAIRAVFAIDLYEITATAGANGSISPAGNVIVPYGGGQRFTFSAASGYSADSLTVDGAEVDSSTGYTFDGVTANHTIHITFRFTGVLIPINLKHGWNIVSLPLVAADSRVHSIFPGASSKAYSYDGNYIQKDTLHPGLGYWIKYPGNRDTLLTGDAAAPDSIPVHTGWNMIGSVSTTVSISSIVSDPPGMAMSQFFGYNSRYFVADSIYPAKGYWVKTGQDGILILNSFFAGASTSARRIRILPNTEFPPPPPAQPSTVQPDLPAAFALGNAYPNPFNPTTIIEYDLPVESKVTLRIYNLMGQAIATLTDEVQQAGSREVSWEGSSVASGLYFYRLEAAAVSDPGRYFSEVRKIVLLK